MSSEELALCHQLSKLHGDLPVGTNALLIASAESDIDLETNHSVSARMSDDSLRK